MESAAKTTISVESTVQAPVEKVWKFWTSPEHIMQWNNASPDWHTPKAENDLRTGGSFLTRMEAKDGSFGFDFEGVYYDVVTHQRIAYTLSDGRTVSVTFAAEDNATRVTEIFEAEGANPVEMQRDGWQAILNNFKQYTEAN